VEPSTNSKNEFRAGKKWQEMVPSDFDDQYGTPQEIFESRLGMAHRLDKDTSGLVIFALNPGVLVNLLSQFKNHSVQKEYSCLTHGKFSVEFGEVTAPISRSSHHRQKFSAGISGRDSITEYQVEKYYSSFNKEKVEKYFDQQQVDQAVRKEFWKKSSMYQGFSLVRCKPKTGRTHQIRVHMSFIKHPLVGDHLYTGKKRSKWDRLWCPRQFLHASQIEFIHPRSGQKMKLTSQLPPDLNQVVELLV